MVVINRWEQMQMPVASFSIVNKINATTSFHIYSPLSFPEVDTYHYRTSDSCDHLENACQVYPARKAVAHYSS